MRWQELVLYLLALTGALALGTLLGWIIRDTDRWREDDQGEDAAPASELDGMLWRP